MRESPFARRLALVLFGIALGLLFVAGYTFYLQRSVLDEPLPATAPPPVMAPAFDLLDQHETRRTDTDLRGKVWLANLAIAACPENCRSVMEVMARVQERLQADNLTGDDVVLITFSAHPLGDTPADMRVLAETHGAAADGWHFLTGADDHVDAITHGDFLLPTAFYDVEDAPYPIVHSSRLVLVDATGQVRDYMTAERMGDDALDFLMDQIRTMVAER